MNKKKIFEILNSEADYLRKEFSVNRIDLFGSFAKGENSINSDIDLIVEFEKPIGLKFIHLTNYIKEK
ncbi:MAG: nucleotidyltransferase domain-containing protein [Melioribacteraceae bacterium]|nr:nucleotidyltransferase domain-containing protein [Melioribacteraceae bacterium]